MNTPFHLPEKNRLQGVKPHDIHPLLWRANGVAQRARQSLETGFPGLNTVFPGNAWPLGNVIEIMAIQPGTVELGLIGPALAKLPAHLPVALVNPPLEPFIQCFWNWQLGTHRWLWLAPTRCLDGLWASEQLLKHNVCGALVCWAPSVSGTSVRRLQLAAQRSNTLCILARHAASQHAHSPAHWRLLASACDHGLQVQLIKRPGPRVPGVVTLDLYPRPGALPTYHDSLDQPAFTRSAFGTRPATFTATGAKHAGLHS